MKLFNALNKQWCNMALKFDNIAFACFSVPFIVDRLTKYFVMTKLWSSQTINQFFNIYVTHNQGIAWGLGHQLDETYVYFLTLLIVSALLYFIWYTTSIAHHQGMLRSCMFIIAGGISNLCDRLWYGSVIDFIQLHAGDWYFPVFNASDVSITVGAFFLIYFALFDEA